MGPRCPKPHYVLSYTDNALRALLYARKWLATIVLVATHPGQPTHSWIRLYAVESPSAIRSIVERSSSPITQVVVLTLLLPRREAREEQERDRETDQADRVDNHGSAGSLQAGRIKGKDMRTRATVIRGCP